MIVLNIGVFLVCIAIAFFSGMIVGRKTKKK